MLILAFLISSIIVFGVIENAVYTRKLKKIPCRVHVNGTRGKSSVVRMISAGLRAKGLRVIAKTTGTEPKLILEDGRELYIRRQGNPTIREQMRVVRFASDRNVDCLVIECMALNPGLQRVSESRMIKSDIGVITNVRNDHIDVMGPAKDDIAYFLSGTVPRNGLLVHSEKKYHELFEKSATRNESGVEYADPEDISDSEMEGFGRMNFRENIAVALKVCGKLGVERNVAIKAMIESNDALEMVREIKTEIDGISVKFINLFAANDVESTDKIISGLGLNHDNTVFVLNCREDRISRSIQFAEYLYAKRDSFSLLALTGDSTGVVEDRCFLLGMGREKVVNMSDADANGVISAVLERYENGAVIIGVGNILGKGMEIVNFFKGI